MTKSQKTLRIRETPSRPGDRPLPFSPTPPPAAQLHPALLSHLGSRPRPGGRSQSESLAPAGSDVPPAAAGFKLPEAAPAPKGVTGPTRARRFASGAGWLRGGDRGGWRRRPGPAALRPGVTAGEAGSVGDRAGWDSISAYLGASGRSLALTLCLSPEDRRRLDPRFQLCP